MPFARPIRSFRQTRLFTRQFLFLFLFAALAAAAAAQNIKQIHPTGYVTDLAHVITPTATARLEALCLELQQKTGAQMAIVTVRSLEGEDVDQYANDLFQQLGVGGKKNDRGVLLLVAPLEHKYRTEVGYGLEPVINDARAGDAGRAMVPFFRQGNYSSGIETGAWQLANYIAADKGVTLTASAPAQPVQPRDDGSSFPIWPIFLLIFVVFHIIRAIFRGTTGRGGRPGGGGWWIGPMIGGMLGGGGFGGSSGGWGAGGGGGFGGFGGGSSGGGGASGSW